MKFRKNENVASTYKNTVNVMICEATVER